MSADRAGDIGSTLRAARERKGVTLREIANRTKISVAVLEALERNDISRLPGGIFSRAFVRSYAHEVGLDPETTIQAFIAQFPQESVTAGHPRSDQVEDTELFESERRVASSVLVMILISVPLAAAVLYLSMSRGRANEASSPPPAPAAPPVEVSRDARTADVPTVAVAPDLSKRADRPAPAAAPVPPPPPSQPAPAAPTTPSAPDAASADDRLTISLSATRPVWISATVDGQKAIGRLLQVGEEETVEVRREMVITAGDAAAIKMTVNGNAARALGKTGEVVTARLSLSNFRDFLLPR